MYVAESTQAYQRLIFTKTSIPIIPTDGLLNEDKPKKKVTFHLDETNV